MQLIGITGGIGMGKTACSDWLISQGYPVSDTDRIARELTASDTDVQSMIRKKFGDGVFQDDGALDRGELARLVFHDDARRKCLESILHPRIREAWLTMVKQWTDEGNSIGFVVIPLLYETQAEPHFAEILCVACLASTQQARLRHRGWSDAAIAARIGAQMATSSKLARADFVIWTEGEMATTHSQLKMVLPRLTNSH
jgi:dephospho-CoA kinase